MTKQQTILWRLAQAAAVALCLGTAIQLFRGGAVSAYLHMSLPVESNLLRLADRGLAVMLLQLCFWAVMKPHHPAWAGVAVLLLLYAFMNFSTAGKWHAEWHLVSAASRAAYPLLLGWWGRFKPTPNQLQSVFRGLLALIFASHGTLALVQTPDFIDYLLGSFHKLSGTYADEGLAGYLLSVVALLDYLTALFLLLRPKRWLLVWALLWIGLTLLMRLLTGGWQNYTEVLVRLPYLFLAWSLIQFRPTSQSIRP